MAGKKIRLQILVGAAILLMLSALCPFSAGAAGNTPDTGYLVTSDLWISAVINTEEKGPVEAVWHKGGKAVTADGHVVFWGYFYALPSDVSWGSENNPDLFVKVWFDASGRVDVNFFHVSVPDIEVYSALPDKGDYAQKETATLADRYIRHEYTYKAEESEIIRPEGWTEKTHSNKADPDYDTVFSDGRVRKVELVIDSADWQAMMDDMTDNSA